MATPSSAPPHGADPDSLPPPPKYASRIGALRQLIFGRPLATSRMSHEKLPKFLALPIFSSDALSSNAYATEAILSVLAGAGVLGALNFSVPIATGISVLMAIVVISYWQIIFAYPNGGGAYPVSRDNLGRLPSLVAAAALLIDYVLTVATSVAAGAAALITADPRLHPWLVPLCIGITLVLMILNLRGVKEAGWTFAGPSYWFIFSVLATVAAGVIAIHTHAPYIQHVVSAGQAIEAMKVPLQAVGWGLILRAFSQGCTALTGVETIAVTVPVFKEPRAINAAITIFWMAVFAITMFMGLTYLSREFGVRPIDENDPHYQTVVGQVADAAWPSALRFMFYSVQYSTAAILIIAANAAFSGFPQVASMLARDSFLPRQLANVGDRLSYANGIVLLALGAIGLILVFKGIVTALLSLYAIGVFTSFTLAQIGMVRNWLRQRGPVWPLKLACNAAGALATGAVTLIIAVSKFDDGERISPHLHFGHFYPRYGTWIVVAMVPIMVLMFLKIRRHYDEMRTETSLDTDPILPDPPKLNVVLVMVPRVHRGVIVALDYARLVSSDIRAVHVEVDPSATPQLKRDWEKWAPDIPLLILESPFRTLLGPILRYIEAVQRERNDDVVTVLVPELVTVRWWHRLLHNQAAPLLRQALASRRDVVVTNVRYFLHA